MILSGRRELSTRIQSEASRIAQPNSGSYPVQPPMFEDALKASARKKFNHQEKENMDSFISNLHTDSARLLQNSNTGDSESDYDDEEYLRYLRDLPPSPPKSVSNKKKRPFDDTKISNAKSSYHAASSSIKRPFVYSNDELESKSSSPVDSQSSSKLDKLEMVGPVSEEIECISRKEYINRVRKVVPSWVFTAPMCSFIESICLPVRAWDIIETIRARRKEKKTRAWRTIFYLLGHDERSVNFDVIQSVLGADLRMLDHPRYLNSFVTDNMLPSELLQFQFELNNIKENPALTPYDIKRHTKHFSTRIRDRIGFYRKVAYDLFSRMFDLNHLDDSKFNSPDRPSALVISFMYLFYDGGYKMALEDPLLLYCFIKHPNWDDVLYVSCFEAAISDPEGKKALYDLNRLIQFQKRL